jgi:hypothetical protein
MTTTAEIKPIEVIYLGRAETDKGKCAMIILPRGRLAYAVNAEGAVALASLFECKERDLPRAIGAVYVFDGVLDEAGSMIKKRGDQKFVPDVQSATISPEWIASWQAQHDARRVAARARKLEAEMAKDNKLSKLLAPLRQQYTATDRIGKLALEVVVLDTMRKGRYA